MVQCQNSGTPHDGQYLGIQELSFIVIGNTNVTENWKSI